MKKSIKILCYDALNYGYTVMKHKKYLVYNFLLLLSINSCQLTETNINPSTPTTNKNVRFVAQMISSSNTPNPSIVYSNQSGGTIQIQQMNLDVTQSMIIGANATLSGSCVGTYSSIGYQSSAVVSLKIYVNDTLKAEGNDLKTDPVATVTATATCSYTIK